MPASAAATAIIYGVADFAALPIPPTLLPALFADAAVLSREAALAVFAAVSSTVAFVLSFSFVSKKAYAFCNFPAAVTPLPITVTSGPKAAIASDVVTITFLVPSSSFPKETIALLSAVTTGVIAGSTFSLKDAASSFNASGSSRICPAASPFVRA